MLSAAMRIRDTFVTALAAAVVAAAPVIAHHSFSAEFDASKEIKATGKVTKLEWTNPHAWFYIGATEVCEGPAGSEKAKAWECEKAGGPNDWGFELASPNGLMRLGWSRNSLKSGEVVTVEGTRARDGSRKGNARSVVMSDGKRMFAGSSQTSTP
jgi:hypothetical protein